MIHAGTYLGANRVVHINPDGLKIESLKAFASGSQIGVVPKNVSQQHLFQRLEKVFQEKKAYDVVAWNCEHLANYLQEGKPESLQLRGAGIGLAAGIGIAKMRKMGMGGTLATVLVCSWVGSQMLAPTII